MFAAAGMTGLAGCSGGGDGGDGGGGDGGDGGDGGGGDGGDTATSSPESEKYGGRITAIWDMPVMDDFDPISASHGNEWAHLVNFTDAPLEINTNNEIVGLMATDWEVMDDGKTWEINLRDDITFHNGEPLKAEHFEYYVDRAQNHPESIVKGSANLIKPATEDGIRYPDDTTLIVEFKEVVAYAPVLFLPQRRILTPVHPPTMEDIGREEYRLTGPGTGPFKIREHTPGEQVVFDRHEDYYLTDDDGNSLPYLDGYTLDLLTEDATQVSAMRSGDADLLSHAPRQSVQSLADAGLEVKASVLSDWRPIEWNGLREPWGPLYDPDAVTYPEGEVPYPTTAEEGMSKDEVPQLPKGEFPDGLHEDALKYRKGLGMLVDQERFIEEALFGLGKPAYGPLNPEYWPKRPTEEKPQTQVFDPERGNELIRESGRDGQTIEIIARQTELRQTRQVRKQINEEADGTVEVEIRQVTSGQLGKEVSDNLTFPMWLGGSSHTWDAVFNMFNHYNPPDIAGWNQSGLNDEEVREWMVEQAQITDRDERGELLNQIEDRALETMAHKYLYHAEDSWVHSSDLNGIRQVPGTRHLRTVWLDE
jgi:peptide/nickel transport system substrate-binding protein